MGRVYATPEQYTAWTGQQPPADIDRLLARASEDVDSALTTAVYVTDALGMPTEPAIVQALADATCAQVEYQRATGDDGTGAAGRWGSVSLGPVSLGDRRDGPAAAGDVDMAPRAHRVLRRAGLLPGVIW
ncbi:hypothetical protein [Streptomyces griseoloalbus]|uniref:Head-to-tail adaptor n=2 Tax=Streptomycetaceae TaxID=2062 RepID=A0A7W8FAR3_9ACTN|nr:hypothetical protein [Streptomyces albaduncus]MBB5128447.1 hypothetical protein [Streptomyces albaduncus]GGW67940.1 hypothetical protein GCM10010340_52580 [Streptomyces albaduncus]